MDPTAPQEDSEPTSATDEELTAASGGKASSGDAIGIVPEDNDRAIII